MTTAIPPSRRPKPQPLDQPQASDQAADSALARPFACDADARAHVGAIVRQANSSFGTAMRLLPRLRREAIYAVYAFCRLVDDIADGPAEPTEKLTLLADWRDEIGRVYQTSPRSLVGQALVAPVAAFNLPQDEFILMIDGMEMDANGPLIAPGLDTLLAYTRRVAGSVGLLSMRIFGAWRGDISDRFALALADALQLTNIMRDVQEDAAIGRLYLPHEYLMDAGIETRTAVGVASHPALPDVCAKLGALATQRFQTARDCIAGHNRFRLLPALMMMGVYETYLRQLRAQNWQCQDGAISLSARRKALCSLRYALLPLPKLER